MTKMRKILWIWVVALLAAATACSGGGSIESVVKDAFIKGDTTQARFDSIAAMIRSNPEANSRFLLDGDELDMKALQEYVNEIGQSLRPPMTWNIMNYGAGSLSLVVYFERSGSMIPYDSKSGGGQLKKTVNDLINFFPDGTSATINIVNDNIYPYKGSIESFLQDRDIYASTEGVGNAAFTDFRLIFDKILNAQKPGQVSVLVTDMIYSPKDTKDLSVDKIFNEENSLATSIFKRNNGKSLIIYKLQGDYNGKYYPYNQAAVEYRGKRPYYVLIIADAKVLDRMAADKAYERFLSPTGAVASYRFNQAQSDIAFNFVLDWKDDAGRYRPSRDDKSTLTHCEGDRTTGVLSFTVAVNLAGLGKSADFLSDAANYDLSSQSDFRLTVKPVAQSDITNNNRKQLEGMTHLLTFTGKFKGSSDDITVRLRNDFPEWIATSSSSDDTSTSSSSFATTTFGLEHFLRGIAAAYPQSDYATLTIHLKK